MRSAFCISVLSALVLGLATGCAHGPRYYPRDMPFVEEEYAPYARRGSATIQGVAYLETSSGRVILGAGSRVYLNPVTSYSREWFDRYVREGLLLEDPDPRLDRYVRETRANRYGRFRFEGVPAGEYYLASPIIWRERLGSREKLERGRIAYAQVRVREGRTLNAILSNSAPWPTRTPRTESGALEETGRGAPSG